MAFTARAFGIGSGRPGSSAHPGAGNGEKKACRERVRGYYMILNLFVLGFVLSSDNFRTSLAVGPLRLRWRHALQVALVFGLWDGVAPLVGVLVGHYVGRAVGPIADYAGPIGLAVFGLYYVIQALRTAAPEKIDHRWSLFGLPLPLSVDNLIAGTSLGMFGLSPWIPAALFAAITTLMSFAGLQLGRGASHLIPIRIRWDLLSGVVLIIMAIVLARAGIVKTFSG
jgi:manganese efflux pump family protein